MEVSAIKALERRRATIRKASARSRVSNGKDVLPNVDGRSMVARRYFDITMAIVSDQGGASEVSETKQQLIRRFAAASVLAETMEARLANGEKIDIAEHALLVSSAVRLARQLGVNRVARDIGPGLGELLRQDHARQLQEDVLQATEKRRQFEAKQQRQSDITIIDNTNGVSDD